MKRIIRDPDIKHVVSGVGKVAVLEEPYLLHPEDYILAAGKNFDMVLSHHKRFVERYDNWSYYPLGGTFIKEEEWELYEKIGGVSMFITEKNTMPGHKLRHKVYNSLRNDIDFYGWGFNAVENKADGLRDYPFSIVIESCQERGYFTEKLLDCFLTGTIPIYWGDPDIGDHFDAKAFIIWDGTISDLEHILSGIPKYGKIAERIWEEGIKENFETAKKYIDYKKTIERMYPEVFE